MKLNPVSIALVFILSGFTASPANTLPAPATNKINVPALSKQAGSEVAINETYILSGSPTSSNGGRSNAGDVMVFRVADGSFVRRIVTPFPATNGFFGGGVALYGNVAYIGAKGETPSPSLPGSGAVYAFDITTGKLLWFKPGRSGQKLGDCLSISGDLIAVGAPGGAILGAPSGSGSVAILDRKTGNEVVSIKMAAAAAGDSFGDSVALQGRLLAAGAPLRDSSGLSNAGEVLLMDAINQQIIATLSASNKQVGAEFGRTVALTKDLLIVGSPFWDNGTPDDGYVYLFNTDGTVNNHLHLVAQAAKKNFGKSLAAAGNMVLVGGTNTAAGGEAFLFDLTGQGYAAVEVAPHTSADAANFGCSLAMTEHSLVIGDNLQPIPGSSNQGALWLGKSLRQHLDPIYRYAKTNSPAPSCNGALYTSIAEPALLEASATVMFRAGLKGKGVTTTNNSAIFNDWSTTLPELVVRKGDKVGGKTVSALGKTFFTTTSNGWPIIQSTTGGVTSLFRDDGTNLITEASVGLISTDSKIASFKAITGAGYDPGTTTFVYAAAIGVKGVTSANDSRVGSFETGGLSHFDFAWEGAPLTVWDKLGQISPRLAIASQACVFHAAITGPTPSTGIMKSNLMSTVLGVLVRKGQPAPGTAGNFSTFIGEGVNDSGTTLFRATTSNGLEGLWTHDGSMIKNIAVKGGTAPGTPSGVKFSRFNRFFVSNSGNVLFTAILAGPGVTTANDQGVWLSRSGTLELILREGDAAPGCDSARISTFSAVDLGLRDGFFSILTTLTGSTSTNQALFYGSSNATSTVGRRPILNLRKGTWIDQPSGQRITSLTVGTHNIDAAGSGSKGTVRLVSRHGALVKVTYSDTVQELMTIAP